MLDSLRNSPKTEWPKTTDIYLNQPCWVPLAQGLSHRCNQGVGLACSHL